MPSCVFSRSQLIHVEQRVISRQEITIMKISPLGQLNQLSLNGIAITFLLQARLDYEKKDDLAMVASWQKN